jgi:hypothetical protein
MARQKGAFPIIGRIGDVSFYLDKQHGYLSRMAGGPSKQQIRKKKSMEVVRQNNSEFGRASRYGSLLRDAFKLLILHCKEYSMSRRLQSVLLSIIKVDESNMPGKRELVKEHLVRLQGFELNAQLSYQNFFRKDVTIEINKGIIDVSGHCILSGTMVKKASHYKVMSVAARVNIEKDRYINDVKESELLSCKGSQTFQFKHKLDEKGLLFYGLVICFYKKKGEKFELIREDKMKAGFVSFVE